MTTQNDTTPEPAGGQPHAAPAAKRRGMPGNAKSIIISMLVVTVAVIAWNATVPRVNKIARDSVDVAGIAQQTQTSLGWNVSYLQPAPKGWIPANVRVVRYENQPPSWQAGYDLPDSKYIAVEQTDKPTDLWQKQHTNSGSTRGTVQIDGVTWTKFERNTNQQRSLVRTGSLNGLATIVTGKADWNQLQQFAQTLRPVKG